MILTACLAVSWLATQGGPVEHSVTLAGRTVKFTFERPKPREIDPEVLNWEGFKFDYSGGRTVQTPYRWLSLPPNIEADYASAHAKASNAAVWRMKVFILTKADILDRDQEGVLRLRRSSLEEFQYERVLQSIARFAALTETFSEGSFRVEPDVEFDNETIRFTQQPGGAEPFGQAFLESYVAPRVNGPGFEQEDRKYRGPYQSVVVVHPGLVQSEVPALAQVGDTPCRTLALYRDADVVDVGSLEHALINGLVEDNARLVQSRFGLKGISHLPENWKRLVSPTDLDAQSHTAFMNAELAPAFRLDELLVSGSSHPQTTLKITQDPERGEVLHYIEHGATDKENPMARGGGAALPSVPGKPLFDATATPILQFYAKATSKDPIGLTLWHGGKPIGEVVIGAANPGLDEGRLSGSRGHWLAFRPDGTWQKVVVDLRTKVKGAVDKITIGPASASLVFEKQTFGVIEAWFDDFEAKTATDEVVEVMIDPTPNDPQGQVQILSEAHGQSPVIDLEFAFRLLADPNEHVRLNATNVFTRVKNPAAEPGLIQNIGHLSRRIGQVAIKALAFQDTPTAWAAIRSTLEIGPDLAKAEAAKQLASRREETLAGPLSVLIANRSRETRLAGAEAIGLIPGDKAQLVLLAFLSQSDPEIRSAVLRLADPNLPASRRQLLYAAVNDTSDANRILAYQRLAKSSDPAVRREALKGVRDDGLWVRRALVEWFPGNLGEESRNALRIAVVDASPSVRAAALQGFAKLEHKATLEEIENTLTDAHPLVAAALIDLAVAANLKLPSATLHALRNHPAKAIAAKASALPLGSMQQL